MKPVGAEKEKRKQKMGMRRKQMEIKFEKKIRSMKRR